VLTPFDAGLRPQGMRAPVPTPAVPANHG
jgi:hypothetical protein